MGGWQWLTFRRCQYATGKLERFCAAAEMVQSWYDAGAHLKGIKTITKTQSG